jgi:hypothetical protein
MCSKTTNSRSYGHYTYIFRRKNCFVVENTILLNTVSFYLKEKLNMTVVNNIYLYTRFFSKTSYFINWCRYVLPIFKCSGETWSRLVPYVSRYIEQTLDHIRVFHGSLCTSTMLAPPLIRAPCLFLPWPLGGQDVAGRVATQCGMGMLRSILD